MLTILETDDYIHRDLSYVVGRWMPVLCAFMGYPRRLLVLRDKPGIYHCVSRCVRRAYLCGVDLQSGRSFEHRKHWIENRIFELAEVFSVAVHAYAVMSNHVHLVVEVDPLAPATWNDEDVAKRWSALFGTRKSDATSSAARIAAILNDPRRLQTLRERLGSLSWFMRALNEPIARRANREDECTGRFWEGRFKCQAILDDAALLACMAYVDLNPVRSGIATSPRASPHTSARRRARKAVPESKLSPLAGSIVAQRPEISEAQYLDLLDWTARSLPGRERMCPPPVPGVLDRLFLSPTQWLVQVPATESHFCRAIGSLRQLLIYARQVHNRWLKGIRFARFVLTLSEPT